MPDYNQTAAAATAIQDPAAEPITREAFARVLEQNITKTWKREFDVVQEGKRYVHQMSTNLRTGTNRTWREMDSTVPQNRDAEDLPVHNWGEGFSWTWVVYTYRDSIAIERELMEIDTEGVIASRQSNLAKKSKRTSELIIASLFNRGVDDGVMANGAPVLCDDGMYLCDSARPNPNPAGGNWSNLESAGAITEASLFQAYLNAKQQVDENGELAPTTIKKIITRPDDGLTLFRLNKSDLRVGTAQNDANWVKGRWPLEEYQYLTDDVILYMLTDSPQSDDNEVFYRVRIKPQFETWLDGSNVDIWRQRVRFAVGIDIGSPRKGWRGGQLA
jgi:hypothetical protein